MLDFVMPYSGRGACGVNGRPVLSPEALVSPTEEHVMKFVDLSVEWTDLACQHSFLRFD